MISDSAPSAARNTPRLGAVEQRDGDPAASTGAAVLIALLVVAGLFAWEGRIGLNFADEGYLWYGAQRALHGDVPLRDFMAYDPGRYYWSAAILAILGNDGPVAVRVALSLFQAVGLALAMFMLAASVRKIGIFSLVVTAAPLAIWMLPRHKLFDISISIMLVGAVFFLLLRPSGLRWFILGIVVGIAAVFGRNHGVYGAFAAVAILAWLSFPGPHHHPPMEALRAFAILAIGVTVGFSPTIAMIAIVPGYAEAFWDSIRFLFEIGNTNLPLPVPWPWLVPVDRIMTPDGLRAVVQGLFFVAALLFATAGAAWVYWARARKQSVPPLVVAALVLSVPYAHVTFSRADISHLAQGIFPVLLAVLMAILPLRTILRWPLLVALGAVSFLAAMPEHPGTYCSPEGSCEAATVAGDELLVPLGVAADAAVLSEVIETYAPDNQSFLVTPLSPGIYAMANRRSPVWEIYALFPRSDAFQRAEIEKIKTSRPGFVAIADVAVDGRDELRFRNTHPLLNHYIETEFDLLATNVGGSSFSIYRDRKDLQ